MNSADFNEFARAAAGSSATRGQISHRFERVTVLGGCKEARALAALWLAQGAEVTLFSAYENELRPMREAKSITLRGEGPIGSFHVDQERGPTIKTTAALDQAIENAQAIFLTGPVHKQRTYAMVLADHLVDGQVVVLPNARTFGAIEAAWLLKIGGTGSDVTLVDMAGSPFFVQEIGSALHLTRAANVPVSTLPDRRENIIAGLQVVFDNLLPCHSALHSAFCDASGSVEVPAMLLGGLAIRAGGPTVPSGGTPLEENHNFRNLIGADHLNIIHGLWDERKTVASCFGVRELPSAEQAVDNIAGNASGDGVRSVASFEDARKLIRCGIIGSLAPLASAAMLAGKEVPLTQSLIAQASTLLGSDLKTAGRQLQTIGINTDGIEDARMHINAIITRARHG